MTITTTAHPVDTDFYQIGDLLGDDDLTQLQILNHP